MNRWIRVAALAALVTSCATPKPTTVEVPEGGGSTGGTKPAGGGTARPGTPKPFGVYVTPPPPTPRPTPTPTPAPTPTPTPPPLVNLKGAIVDANDQVVDQAVVRVFATDGDGTPIAEAKTDAQGNFSVEVPRGRLFNVEAAKTDPAKGDLVGFKANVRVGVPSFQVTIAKGSRVLGKVSAPKAPAVKDFSGVVVTIPGSPYKTTAKADGAYELLNVPAGTFDVFASKEGLGSALGANVQVRPNQDALVGLLSFDVTTPKIVAVAPASGGVGAEFRVSGSGFGQDGAPVVITVGGIPVVTPARLSDATLTGIVPAGAKSGEVLVKIGELPSNPGSFQVIKTVAIAAQAGPMLVGDTRTYVAVAKDETGAAVASPPLDWSGTAGLVEAKAGFVKALALGQATLEARSGDAVGSLAVTIAPFLATVATLAGGAEGHADGDGTAAKFRKPAGLLIGADGELYVADPADHRIRRVTRAGAATTIAGDGTAGHLDAETGAEARFDAPWGLALGATLLVAEGGQPGLRAIDLAAAGKPVTAFAGDGTAGDAEGAKADARFTEPAAIATAGGDVYVADAGAHRIRKIAGDGQVTTFAGAASGFADGALADARFNAPRALLALADGSLIVADAGNHRIRKIKDGQVTTLAGGAEGDAVGPAADARFKAPAGLAAGPDGALVIADSGNHRLKLLTAAGQVFALAGAATAGTTDGPGDAARFNTPWGLAVDAAGVLYVADKDNARLRTITLTK